MRENKIISRLVQAMNYLNCEEKNNTYNFILIQQLQLIKYCVISQVTYRNLHFKC
jgi:hypothetical protein